MLVLSTHSNKRVGPWYEFITHVVWDLAGGGEHVEVEVSHWDEGRFVEAQPANGKPQQRADFEFQSNFQSYTHMVDISFEFKGSSYI